MSSYSDICEAACYGTVDDVKYFIEEKGVDVNSKTYGSYYNGGTVYCQKGALPHKKSSRKGCVPL